MIKVNVNLLKKYNALSIVKFAILFQIVVGLIFILIHQNITLIQTVIVLAAYMSMMAFVFGNCMAIALEHFSKNAGVASGVIGVFIQSILFLFSKHIIFFH
jgi:DHA1 family bicyclomycin/chloramphenicol resistance-like MFS transporter